MGKWAEDVVLDKEFWKNVRICYKSTNRLLFALGLANLTKEPAMGFIYDEMEKAKEEIRMGLSEGGVERESLMLTQQIIDECWDQKVYSPLHAAGYYLNPQFHDRPGLRDDIKIKHGLQQCITRMVADPEERSKIETQLDDFDKEANDFSHPIASITSAEEIPAI
ncbi:HAT family dimerization domain containing protein, partial [Trifolium pratense]